MVVGILPKVEAFPNAFIAVTLSDDCFGGKPRPRKRFDWLYDKALCEGVFSRLLDHLAWVCPALLNRLSNERDHEKRAALIILISIGAVIVNLLSTILAHRLGLL